MRLEGIDRDFPDDAKVFRRPSPPHQVVEVLSAKGGVLWNRKAVESDKTTAVPRSAIPSSAVFDEGKSGPLPYVRPPTSLGHAMEEALLFQFNMVARQAVAAQTQQARDFFDGWMTGAQLMLATLASVHGYSLDFLKEETTHHDAVPESTTTQPAPVDPRPTERNGQTIAGRGAAGAPTG